jgi:hypothetical protein
MMKVWFDFFRERELLFSQQKCPTKHKQYTRYAHKHAFCLAVVLYIALTMLTCILTV